MPRTVIYVLVTKNGPSEAEQVAAIRRRVTLPDNVPIYTDDLTVRRRKADPEFPQRGMMERHLRKGDTAAVSSPGRLGRGRDDARAVLHAIARKGCGVLDASTGIRLVWTDEIADAVEFLARVSTEHNKDVLRAARAAKAAAGIVYRPQPKELAVSQEAAERIWRDTARYNREEAGKACGVSWKTLHNRFGGRTEAMGTRPKKVQPRRRK